MRRDGAGASGGGLRGVLFPQPPRTLPGARAWQIGARTVHIAAMGLVLGGVAYGLPFRALAVPITLTLASGTALLGIDLWKSGAFLHQGCGIAVLLKLALLGVGFLVPSLRLEFYLAATAVASIGSHMPRTWRHWSILEPKSPGRG